MAECSYKGFIIFAVIALCSLNTVHTDAYQKTGLDILRRSGFESDKDLQHFRGIEIGNKAIFFRRRNIGQAIVQGDFAAYHFDRRSGRFKDFRLHWRDDLPDSLPDNIISRQEAEIAAGGRVRFSRLYILSEDSGIILMDEVPSEPCWIVETLKDGIQQALIVNALDGQVLGHAALPPSEAFSVTGPTNISGCSGGWYSWYSNAAGWFSAMGYQTDSVVYASQQMMEEKIKTVAMFYELAHGGSSSFTNDCGDSTSGNEIAGWLIDLSPVPFSFVGSCGGLCSTGPGSLSYSLRKGISIGTAVVGYCGMADAPCVDDCWYAGFTVAWQDRLFEEMNNGKTVGEAFDIANVEYPGCSLSECMRFDGDPDLKAVPKIIRNQKNIIYVDSTAQGANNGSSWQNAYTELRTAMQASEVNSHIYIAAGMYKPADSGANRGESFTLKNGLELYGGFPPGGSDFNSRAPSVNKTVLSGDLTDNDDGLSNTDENSFHVIYAYDVTRFILDGLVIKGGNANGSDGPGSMGGGLYCRGSGRIENCTFEYNGASSGGAAYFGPDECCVTENSIKSSRFENNHSSLEGGAIWVGDSDLDIQDVTITNNVSDGSGGGIMFGNDNYSNLKGCSFISNQAGTDGGGLYTQFSFGMLIEDSDFKGNISSGNGGGIFLGHDSEISIHDSTFESNSAAQDGGGIYVFHGMTTSMERCSLENNTAVQGGGIYTDSDCSLAVFDLEVQGNRAETGASIFNNGGDLMVQRTRIYGNIPESTAGILYNISGTCQFINCAAVGNFNGNTAGSSIVSDYAFTTLVNCSFISNSYAETDGIMLSNNSRISIFNSIVRDTIEIDGYSTAEVRHSNVPDYTNDNNIDTDPGFQRDPYDGSDGWGIGNNDDYGDLHLRSDSPCYNSGNNDLVPDTVTRDIDGLDRIIFGTVDMGAHELNRKVLYEITDLGSLGGDTSQVRDINNNGQAAGWSSIISDPPDTTYHATLYVIDGNNIDLGTLGGNWSKVWSINNTGLSVGQSRTGDEGYVYHSTLFNSEEENKDLGDLGGGSGWAYDLNDSGITVGTTTRADKKWQATLFDLENGQNQQIYGSGSSNLSSGAWAINEKNDVAGYAQIDNGQTIMQYPFLFDLSPLKSHIQLSQLPGQAVDINDDGMIIGNITGGAVLLNQFDPDDNIMLGSIAMDTGTIDSNARGINNNGQVVGSTSIEIDPMSDHVPVAILFDPTGSGDNIDLNSAVDSSLGWELREANSINDNGWIVGNGINGQGQYRGFVLRPIIDNFMAAYWMLDDSGNEARDSVNGNHGTVGNGSEIGPGRGRIGGGAYFNGQSDAYIDCGNSRELSITGQLSVCAWIKVETFDREWQAIVTKGDRSWRLSRNAASDTLHFACTGLKTSGDSWVNGMTNVNDGIWHHVAGVYNGTELLLYIDGKLDGRVEARGPIQSDDSAVMIGENSMASGRNFRGWIDDVRVYAYPLSESYVSELADLRRIIKVDQSALGNSDGTTWVDAYNCVQDALHAAKPGDTIYIAEGTYRPGQRYGSFSYDKSLSFELFDDLEIYGGFPSGGCNFDSRQPELHLTVLTGDMELNDGTDGLNKEDNNFNVIRIIDTAETVILDGLIIEKGHGYGPDYEKKFGAGILILNSSVNINECILRDNYAEMRGGGMYIWMDSDVEVRNCRFSGNKSGSIGGGICSYGNANLSGCLFNDNIADHAGGGFWGSAGSFSGCIFSNNISQSFGGGIYSISDADITHCLLNGNSSNYGGAITVVDSDIEIALCTISGNTAETTAGGIYCDEGWFYMNHSIVWNNTDQDGSVENSQFDSFRKPTIDFSCIQGLSDSSYGTGNFDLDPLFADPPSGDFHLKSSGGRWNPLSGQWIFDNVNSGCIDAGNPSMDIGDEIGSLPGGDPEYVNQRINIGVYGNSSQASLATVKTSLLTDITNDKKVDFMDMSILSELWESGGEGMASDFDKDGDSDIDDLIIFAVSWMRYVQ